MQRNERTPDRGGGGDTYVQASGGTRGGAGTTFSKGTKSNIGIQKPRPFKTPAPLLGSPSEFMQEALLRGLLPSATAHAQTTTQEICRTSKSSYEYDSFPPILLQREATKSSTKQPPESCTSCSEFPPSQGHLLEELRAQCRRENRNPTLYRIATPLEISRIPEHLRNLKTIPLEPPKDDIDDDTPPDAPLPYYLPKAPSSDSPKKQGIKKPKHPKLSRKPQAYWRWEKPDKTKPIELPSACRIVEEARQPEIPTAAEPKKPHLASLVDFEDGESESDEELMPEFTFEIVQEPPTRKNPKPITSSTHCGPKMPQKQDQIHTAEYNIYRGPKLLIKTRSHEIILHNDPDYEHNTPIKLFIEPFDDFAATSKCCEIQKITLLNEGTTAIRFQWIRAPPGPCIQKFLGNSAKLLDAGKSLRRRHFPLAVQAAANQKHQQHCGDISSGPRKMALHLTTSRRVNPALTRAIKILNNTVSSDTAFRNLLLLLSLRVPRLKRELIRRTKRQLSSRTLPRQIHDLYLRLRKQRRVKYYQPVKANRRRLQSRASFAYHEDLPKDECTCDLPSDGDSSDSSQSDASYNFFLFPNKLPHECVCSRPASPPAAPPTTALQEECVPEDTSTPPITMLPEDMICFYPPQMECICEGICICEPPAEDQGICVCGPCCICSPQASWGALKYWSAGEQETSSCTCIGVCSCGFPATPPPTHRAESQTSCICIGTCDCGQPKPEYINCTCDGPCICELPPEDESCPFEAECTEDACPCPDPCACDIPETVLCTCGPICTCISPPFSASCSQGHLPGSCLCTPCTCDPPPEEAVCTCGPFCTCKTPPASDVCFPTLPIMPPEDCTCSACKCGDFQSCENKLMSRGTQLHPLCYEPYTPPQTQLEETEQAGEEYEVPDSRKARPSYFLRFYSDQFSNTCVGEDAGEGAICPPAPKETVPKKAPKIRKTRKVEFIKPNCPEFIFCELPQILLPGQKYKFEIMFRPEKPGIYSETIYLLTHPRLTSGAYGIHLRGLCINPESSPETCNFLDNVQDDRGDHEPSLDTSCISKTLFSKIYDRQANQALHSIMDHVLHFQPEQKLTCPYGRLTSEAIFKTHNRHLHYYPDSSESALHIVKTLLQLLVAKTNIVDNPAICERNITKLYYELLKPSSEQDYFDANLLSDEVEGLLAEFRTITTELTRPPVFMGMSAAERCDVGLSVSIHAMVDELTHSFNRISETVKNKFTTHIWRTVLDGKLTKVREAEIEAKLQNQRLRMETKQRTMKWDISTQTGDNSVPNLDDEDDIPVPEVPAEDIEYQLHRMYAESIRESRLASAQSIIANAIERMVSFMDASENLCDYEKQQVIVSPGDDDPFRCCQ